MFTIPLVPSKLFKDQMPSTPARNALAAFRLCMSIDQSDDPGIKKSTGYMKETCIATKQIPILTPTAIVSFTKSAVNPQHAYFYILTNSESPIIAMAR